jgi:lysophospholipase L1-like esterase
MKKIGVVLWVVLIGCSASTGGTSAPGGGGATDNGNNGGNPAGNDAGNGSGNSSGKNSGNGSGNTSGHGTDGGSSNGGGANGITSAKIGTYIPLGDSISDLGGTGPFFYDLLLKNDDTTWPTFQGHDLTTRFPGVMYDHRAIAGSITDTYLNGPLVGPTLKSQIDLLGNNYPGDVLVTITIGGNDLNGHSLAAIGGTDGPARMEFQQHLADELAELTMPGRLGSGRVYVVLANIYDFTDGQGDFATVLCGPPDNIGATQDAAVFSAWNGVMQSAIANVNGVFFDMHARFMGHGFDAQDVWYDRVSCIHPNAKGHNEIRRAIWQLVTGETI